MSHKKSEKPESSDENEILVRRVDDMMSTEPIKITPTHDSDASQTAPKLPTKLLKELKEDEEEKPEQVLKISNSAPLPEPRSEEPIELPIPATDAAATEQASEPLPEPEATSDDETDKAIDDIVSKEGDTILALEDAKTKRQQMPVKTSWKQKLRNLVTGKWFWIILVVLLLAVFAVPLTRYKILGLVWKKQVSLQVIDSKTATPVSNALVSVGGDSAKTDADGKVQFKAGLGKQTVTITKQYYTTASTSYFVGFKASTATPVKLVATGRLIPITVKNTITGKPLAGVQIKILNTVAKTDGAGKASVGVPVGKNILDAQLSLSGYNTTLAGVEVTDKVVKQNTISITPAGHVYFLSNATSKLDVVKTNLDGSSRKTVLEGTGQEEKGSTTLLASRDWRYLVLKARRDTPQAALYLIDTQTDKVTKFDTSDANFTLVGWYNHSFIYELTRNNQSNWTAGTQLLKSYDADHLQLNQLDQNQAEGDSTSYAYQDFQNFYILNNVVTYTTQWYAVGLKSDASLSAKNNTIRAIQPSGQNKKDYQDLPSATSGFGQAQLYEPQGVYYSVYDSTTNKTTYYKYEDQDVKIATVDQSAFNSGYPTYLLSPSGSKTFWTELRDGKNSLFVGDANAASKKQVANPNNYTPYGWFGDDYTLASKNSSELYIMPANGVAVGQQPLKITDYYKPAQSFAGYGYGYGGL